MNSLVVGEGSLTEHAERTLGENGRLSRAIPGFVAREAQVLLARHVARAIDERGTLIAEAGTGTGKTYAYLVPCLLSGQKVVISTATKTLQDQLFQKDLPQLLSALAHPIRVQNLKGRANYICRHRVALHVSEARLKSAECAEAIAYVHEKLPNLTVGDRTELPEISDNSPVWPYVTSSTDNCLGAECEHHKTCFLMEARKRALEADLVVINHHLFFADSRLKEEGFGELLPLVDVVVFDEAHQLPDIAVDFYESRVSTRMLTELLEDMQNEWPVLDLANQPLKLLRLQLDRLIDDCLLKTKPDARIAFTDLMKNQAFKALWAALLALLMQCLPGFASVELKAYPGLLRCKARLEAVIACLSQFENQTVPMIHWVDCFKHSLVFHATPFEIAHDFQALMKRKPCTYIFTSATLAVAGNFGSFQDAMGLKTAKTLCLDSPFDFQTQALLYLPRGLPDPKHIQYDEVLLNKAVPIIQACGGRCFFLFTSHRALQRMAYLLKSRISFPMLVQGEEAKPILLARFRELGNAVLLGTATFWEGVDVKGDALSCVIIDKIPFLSPVDPIIRGKMAHLKTKGLSGFDVLSLPQAVLALKQGAGRLIRDMGDKGILMIADPRLVARAYGQTIFASLPSMPKTRDEKTALHFIQHTVLAHELPCH